MESSGSGPPPFWGTPKLHKEGKNVAACARMSRILVLNSYMGHPPFRNPVSTPVQSLYGPVVDFEKVLTVFQSHDYAFYHKKVFPMELSLYS